MNELLRGSKAWAKKFLKKFLAPFLGVMGVFSVIFLLTVIYWISNPELEEMVAFVKNARDAGQQKTITFGAEGIVGLEDFRDFYLFTGEQQDFQDWFDSKNKEELLTRLPDQGSGSEILFTKELQVADLVRNDCEKIYCFQHRVGFDEIPGMVWKGLIAIEDNRYLDHQGVDFKSILRAIVADLRAMKLVQGGSTLTQQLAKNLFLTNEKSILRKFKEIFISLYLESKLEKEEIITAYLNEIYWGSLQNLRIKGIYSASLFYFGKRPSSLGPFEVSILIGLLKGPNYYSPLRSINNLKSRAYTVYNKLLDLNVVPQDKKLRWDEKDWADWLKRLSREKIDRPYFALWQLKKDEESLFNRYEQYALNRSIRKTLITLQDKVEKQDIAVKILMDDLTCKENCKKPFVFYSKTERDLQRAIDEEKQQVGSILKPIIYNIFLEFGYNLEDMVSTEKVTLKLKSGEWSPKEAGKVEVTEMSLLDAIRESRNRPLIRIASEIGMENIEPHLLEYLPELQRPLKEYPAQLIGSLELSVKRVYEVYKHFIKEECIKYKRVEEGENAPREKTGFSGFFGLGDKAASAEKKAEAGSGAVDDPHGKNNLLFQLSDPKKSTVKNIVAPRISELSFFGKTGTTNNGLDNWYVFFNGRELGVIWLGLEGVRQDHKLSISGASSAFRIYNNFIGQRGKKFTELTCKDIDVNI